MKMHLSTGVVTGSFLTRKLMIIIIMINSLTYWHIGSRPNWHIYMTTVANKDAVILARSGSSSS